MSGSASKVRCAVYTRKSSEEGLEQGFNSLDAQHEACSAYILSQASEGWQQVAERYDDGGLSGGTLERPALQRLMADIAAGRIDTVVVYKVDRLTRSLLDFAKLVEAFDKAGVSFVSVTQSFNTTTSMGRLTLNMLLSFAQFEREVTAERIRDKIAASKARGMWMGGTPPVGYRPDGRSLAIVPEEAAMIRGIYARYLELGNVRLLAAELDARGVRTPVRVRARSGQAFGGRPFSRGQLYALLRSPIYAGRIPHRGASFAGKHIAIIDDALWNAVQDRLTANIAGTRRHRESRARLLQGLITDGAGERLIITHARKGTVRYCYYTSKTLQEGSASTVSGLRIPAREIEHAVTAALAALFDDPLELASAAGLVIPAGALPQIFDRSAGIAAELRQRSPERTRSLLKGVRVHAARFELELSTTSLAEALELEIDGETPDVYTHGVAVRLTRTGRAMRLVQDNGALAAGTLRTGHEPLLRLIVKGRQWWSELCASGQTIRALAAREGVTPSWMTRVVRLAFLSPAVTEAALDGSLRAGFDMTKLLASDAIPADWATQEALLLPEA